VSKEKEALAKSIRRMLAIQEEVKKVAEEIKKGPPAPPPRKGA